MGYEELFFDAFKEGCLAVAKEMLPADQQRRPLYPHTQEELKQLINNFFDNLSPEDIKYIEYELNRML